MVAPSSVPAAQPDRRDLANSKTARNRFSKNRRIPVRISDLERLAGTPACASRAATAVPKAARGGHRSRKPESTLLLGTAIKKIAHEMRPDVVIRKVEGMCPAQFLRQF